MDIQADIRDLFILAHRIAAAAWSQDTGVTPEEDFLGKIEKTIIIFKKNDIPKKE